jgi:hypothetical protein
MLAAAPASHVPTACPVHDASASVPLASLVVPVHELFLSCKSLAGALAIASALPVCTCVRTKKKEALARRRRLVDSVLARRRLMDPEFYEEQEAEEELLERSLTHAQLDAANISRSDK